MRTTYTIQVSNRPSAGSRLPSESDAASWRTVYDGPVATSREARRLVDELAQWFRHVRAFRGRDIGRLWYANLSTRRYGTSTTCAPGARGGLDQ